MNKLFILLLNVIVLIGILVSPAIIRPVNAQNEPDQPPSPADLCPFPGAPGCDLEKECTKACSSAGLCCGGTRSCQGGYCYIGAECVACGGNTDGPNCVNRPHYYCPVGQHPDWNQLESSYNCKNTCLNLTGGDMCCSDNQKTLYAEGTCTPEYYCTDDEGCSPALSCPGDQVCTQQTGYCVWGSDKWDEKVLKCHYGKCIIATNIERNRCDMVGYDCKEDKEGSITCKWRSDIYKCVPDAPTIPPGNVSVQASIVGSANPSCDNVRASTDYLVETVGLSPNVTPATKQTTGTSTPVTWTGLAPGTYTLSPAAPAGYVLRAACWQQQTPAGQGSGLSAQVESSSTLAWNLGYSLGIAWSQIMGGDVYGRVSVSSPVPDTITPRVFVRDGDGGTPGVVTYGTAYDFSADVSDQGSQYVSSTNWLVHETYTSTNYYQLFYQRFGGTPSSVDYPTGGSVSQPAYREDMTVPYYATGDVTTEGNWVIDDGKMLVVFVDGNLTIGGTITTSGTGFVAFIVNGNITVSPSVGVPYTSRTPVVEGVYITSPTGVFHTGDSSSAGNERFVGSGVFVAGNFALERDLAGVGANNTASSELFIYDPSILLTMPERLKETPVFWQEAAP